jgi:hypothetical protein
MPLARPQVTSWSSILQCCAKGFYGIHTILPCPYSYFHYHYCVAAWVGCFESDHLFYVPFHVGWGRICPASAVRGLYIQTLTSSG